MPHITLSYNLNNLYQVIVDVMHSLWPIILLHIVGIDSSSDSLQQFLRELSKGTARAYKQDLTDFARWFYTTNDEHLAPALVTSIDLKEYQNPHDASAAP